MSRKDKYQKPAVFQKNTINNSSITQNLKPTSMLTQRKPNRNQFVFQIRENNKNFPSITPSVEGNQPCNEVNVNGECYKKIQSNLPSQNFEKEKRRKKPMSRNRIEKFSSHVLKEINLLLWGLCSVLRYIFYSIEYSFSRVS